MCIPLYDLNSLLIDISTFNEPRSVNNVQGEPCPCAGAHRWPQTLRLQIIASNNTATCQQLQQESQPETKTGRNKTWKALTVATLSPTIELTVDDFPTPPFPITRIVSVLTFFTSETQTENQ
jgi:hypothetical protein